MNTVGLGAFHRQRAAHHARVLVGEVSVATIALDGKCAFAQQVDVSVYVEASTLQARGSICQHVGSHKVNVDLLTIVDGDGPALGACQRKVVEGDRSLGIAVHVERAVGARAGQRVGDGTHVSGVGHDAHIGAHRTHRDVLGQVASHRHLGLSALIVHGDGVVGHTVVVHRDRGHLSQLVGLSLHGQRGSVVKEHVAGLLGHVGIGHLAHLDVQRLGGDKRRYGREEHQQGQSLPTNHRSEGHICEECVHLASYL